jgi:hypothetical protein
MYIAAHHAVLNTLQYVAAQLKNCMEHIVIAACLIGWIAAFLAARMVAALYHYHKHDGCLQACAVATLQECGQPSYGSPVAGAAAYPWTCDC